MSLARISPGERGFEELTFECSPCGRTEKMSVEVDPTPMRSAGWPTNSGRRADACSGQVHGCPGWLGRRGVLAARPALRTISHINVATIALRSGEFGSPHRMNKALAVARHLLSV
jgi:hypothetical protein